MSVINLWEAMTASERNQRLFDRGKFDGDLGPKVNDNDLLELGKSARYCSGQELSIEPTSEGWLIEVFSCYDGSEFGESGEKIKILIPKDYNRKVEVNYVNPKGPT